MTTSAPASAESTDRYTKSMKQHQRALGLMPGGVSSPVRAYGSVGRTPVTLVSGKGPVVTDVDGNTYLDYVLSYGPMILGHTPEAVSAALSKTVGKGWTFGAPTKLENDLAEVVIEAVPSIEKVRFVNSGTEAAMSAIRLARAYTGRSKVIKAIGCYHGHSDALLVEAGSGAATLGVPSSPGVPQSITAHTLLVPFNDAEALTAVMQEHGSDVAAIALEPVAGNMGCVPPEPGYLEQARALCDEHGAALLFDEVMTGFRVAWGGAQTLLAVEPDLTCLGKVVGGGLPCAAYGGREEIMAHVAPQGPMYQAGTLSGNPLAMAAGLTTLETLRENDGSAYAELERCGAELQAGLVKSAERADCPITVQRVGSMLTVFFTAQAGTPVRDYAEASACSRAKFAAFFGVMLDAGVMLPPSPFEAWFLSTTHDAETVKQTLAASGPAFAAAAAVS